jgi:hypothetical protein
MDLDMRPRRWERHRRCYQKRYVCRVKRLPVDLPALAALFDEPRNGPVRSFFDRVTGELESMPRDAEVEGVYDDIVNAPDRWVEVQALAPRERRDLRQRFADERLHDVHVQLRLRLFDALASGARPDARPADVRRSLAQFEAVLREGRDRDRALLDEWLAFRAAALLPLARAWLSALGVEAVSDADARNQAS